MSQSFVAGQRVPVTRILAGPCSVTQIKKKEKDGYQAIQLGLGQGKKAPLFLREVKVKSLPKLKVGQKIKVADIFQKGDKVRVTGTSKGKGFAGVVKRWGFKGGPRTHGQSDRERAPGSIGQTTSPGRVWKGKKMPGRMGKKTVTIKGLKVVDIDEEKNILLVSGPVPGPRGEYLFIQKQ